MTASARSSIVVGAGPTGLAVAHELARRGLSYGVLERGQVGETWRHHHTLKQRSALPGRPMAAPYPRCPSRTRFLAYLEQYARHFELRVGEGVKLRRAAFDGRRLDTSRGALGVAVLAMATGIWSAPVRPLVPGEEQFASEGRPVLDRYGRAASNPCLGCVGYTYPTTERWIQAVGRVAERVVEGIVALPRETATGLAARSES